MTNLSTSEIIETEHTDNIVCPYCGHKDRDSWEVDLGPGLEGTGEVDCDSCDRTFVVTRNVTVTYTTKAVGI